VVLLLSQISIVGTGSCLRLLVVPGSVLSESGLPIIIIIYIWMLNGREAI
jgi:hypothetical protein